MKKCLQSILVVGLFSVLTACSDNDSGSSVAPAPQPERGEAAPTDSGPTDNIVETAVNAGSFTTLVAAVQAAGLDEVLSDESATFTVFAPTDAAFEVLGEDTIAGLLADEAALSNVLLYHVIPGQSVDANTALSLAGSMVEVANGDRVSVTASGGQLFINDSRVVTNDIQTTNGIIHVIDAVLLPPAAEMPQAPVEMPPNIVETAVAAGDFEILVAALQATGLDTVLAQDESMFTVFAPTDDAFTVLGEDTINGLLADPDTLSDILLYHVVAGGELMAADALAMAPMDIETANGDAVALSVQGANLFINDSRVVVADIETANGIIHVIDAVLLPPADGTTPEAPLPNIVDTAVSAGSFTTLVAALQATGLDSVLADGDASFTVFAPTDDAFAALGEETINALLADPDALSQILLYHVVAGAAVPAEQAIALAGSDVETANGASVSLSLQGESLFVDNARVVITDIETSNGIIHVIDAVLLPPGV